MGQSRPVARALAVWHPVATGGSAEVIGSGLSFLRAKAQQHGVLRAGR